MTVATPTPDDIELLAAGACDVAAAVEFASIPERELWHLMRDGLLPWFYLGRKRLIPRRSLIEYLARVMASDREERGRKQRD